ncbi:putative membrane protein [Rhodovulum iodosum]|uniref:Membrane protein n=1 Tax=Rhodovulum iodosum TaxID=68291 RepID=A0ABV3XQ68_9RHOB|nr:DUF2244 domain-containing protein [Rhodovulum robiginosum]RSK34821.1 DUF2244 domain-containing protein [Rhodovulum robiginosum]
MPHRWTPGTAALPPKAPSYDSGGPAALRLRLWPHRSLPRKGFAAVILMAYALILVPLIAVIGTPVLWGLLPFGLIVLGMLWYFLERSYKDGELIEELSLWPDRVELTRHNPRGPRQDWHANPYWVRVELHREGGPVTNYVTLEGGGREVEIGAFLSPEERLALHDELQRALHPA